jgi:hypothetical protein
MNYFYSHGFCEGFDSNIPYCRPYLTEELRNVSESTILQAIQRHIEDERLEEEKEKRENNFFRKYWIHILVGVVLVGGATGATMYIVKRRSAL